MDLPARPLCVDAVSILQGSRANTCLIYPVLTSPDIHSNRRIRQASSNVSKCQHCSLIILHNSK